MTPMINTGEVKHSIIIRMKTSKVENMTLQEQSTLRRTTETLPTIIKLLDQNDNFIILYSSRVLSILVT